MLSKLVYNVRMKWLILLTIMCLQGCAYTAVSTASFAATGKSVGDHVLTQAIPHSDCSSLNLLDSKYYCEISDPSKQYNRMGY
jgi:hypothetical protein